jgi:hypothetical protein
LWTIRIMGMHRSSLRRWMRSRIRAPSLAPIAASGSSRSSIFASEFPPEAHPGRGAAVHVEDLPCDEVSSVGDEEGYCGGDVFRVSDTAPWDQGIAELGSVVWDVEVAGDLYDARADGVDADLVVCELYGEWRRPW